jgi:hypothetical protein
MNVAQIHLTMPNSTLILGSLPEVLSTMSNFTDDTTTLLQDNSQSTNCMPMTVVTTKSFPIPVTSSAVSSAPNERVASLDQYRGFVILCSLFMPLLGRLKAMPAVFRHNRNFFSIAGSYA